MNDANSAGEDVYRLADDVSLQPLGEGEGGVVLMLKSGDIYTVNDTTLDFLTNLDGARSLRACAEAIAAVYDIDPATAAADLAAIAADLASEQIVIRVA
ncbi:PqqD family peptide modification chaperone [Aquibium microcysteis]|uniref:PqqD family peptide modification chaperone n=1 Tax=Aquibium microcysteis TaxID=675281 RepID=UPI00165D23B1|nr:PqqD family peptide modification chaperone [Aquibium microcysteis]